ncbi:helix-turn-helix domain-containing protein [Haloplanus halophilus]|uniref:helix-turn-helix domain-containing protein n=1 Tax=Haloplanus halophilus TaxID=2949993 RepID=UPI0020408E5C|nr:helix-turn-helix domain-containing protein [Haloplanus sp. GDY1]
MATIVLGTVPAEEFALARTLDACPDLSVETERIVETGKDTVMPLLWARGTPRSTVEEALAADPSVDNVTLLDEFDDELLYRMEWIDHVQLLVQMLANSSATVMDAWGSADRWELRVLYPDRDHFSRTHEFCAEHGLGFDVRSIRDLDGEPAGRYGLTDEQYRALAAATRAGYFDVPRSVDLESLAEEFDISHQALSERLRRGTKALVEDTLFVGEGEPDDPIRSE